MNAIVITSNGTIAAIINSKTYSISPGAFYYNDALKAAKIRDFKALLAAFDLDSSLKDKSGGKVTFENGVIRYNGAAVDNKLSKRILKMLGEGHNCDPFMRFMEWCYQNPNPTVIDRLYDFMENVGIMLDDEGYIVAFKKVRDDGYDYYSGTVLYEVGKVVEMDRNKCDGDSRNGCSFGLNSGSLNYSQNLWYAGEGRILLCRINPKDVVSVPEDHGFQKMRTCRMEIVRDITGEVKEEYPSVYSLGASNLQQSQDFDENLENDEDFDEEEWNSAWTEAVKSTNSRKRDSLGRFTGGFSSQPRDSNGKFIKAIKS